MSGQSEAERLASDDLIKITAWFSKAGMFGYAQQVDEARQLLDVLQAQVEQGARREADLMRACLKAEKFDAQYENSRLPGDSALSALFNSFEERLALSEQSEKA